MDRKEILVLKPNAAIRRGHGLCLGKFFPMLGRRLLCKPFFTTTVEAITYAIQVKQRYLKLKEYSEANCIQLDIPIKMRKIGSTVVFTCTCGQTTTFEYKK